MAGTCLHVHRLDSHLDVLNEVDVPVWIATYNPKRVYFPWCNTSNLKMWKKSSVEEFAAIDVFTHRSEAVQKVQNELYQVTQVEKRINHSRHTFYPGGTAVTCDMSFIPIQVVNECEEEETMCMVTCKTAILDMDEGQREANRSHEMLRHTPVHTMLFTCGGDHIQSNVTARNYYHSIINRRSNGSTDSQGKARTFDNFASKTSLDSPKGRKRSSMDTKNGPDKDDEAKSFDMSSITLLLVLLTCVWEECHDETETQEELFARICALRLGDAAIKIERKKLVKRQEQLSGGASGDSAVGGGVGGESYFDISFFPLVDPGTGLPAIMVKEVDVTELELKKQAEEELVRAMKQQETFMAVVSHELRTPLNGVVGLTEHILEELEEDEEAADIQKKLNDTKENMEIVLHSSKQLCLLINDILDSTLLKHGTYKIDFARVDVDQAISQVCGQLGVLCQPGVRLSVGETSMGGGPYVWGDYKRVCQILTNLIGNALKFTHEGSVTVSARKLGKCLKIEVEDTGIGISKEDMEQIFLPFVQADMSAQRRYEGTGLGLSLVRSLVEAHGGKVTVESKLGEGTKIGFTLQMHAEGEAAAPGSTVVPSSTGAGGLIKCQVAKARRMSFNQLNLMQSLERYGSSDGFDGAPSRRRSSDNPDFYLIHMAALNRISQLESELEALRGSAVLRGVDAGKSDEFSPSVGDTAALGEVRCEGGIGRPRGRFTFDFPPSYPGP